jgi:hypothetical protein
MKKWWTQTFGGGGGSSADTFEGTDNDPGNNTIDLKIGNNTYSMPKTLFKNVGNYDGKNNANKGYMAAVYAAYQISTGQDPFDVAAAQLTKDQSGRPINEYIVNTLLKDWVEGQGGLYEAQTDYNLNNLNELHDSSKSLQAGISTALNSDSVSINNQTYTAWRANQPQFKEGYSVEYGVPVGKDSTGSYIYQSTDGTYINPTGAEITDFTNAVDIKGNIIQFDDISGRLINPATGEPIEPDTPSAPPATPKEDMFNKYYENIWSQKEGTLGKQILDNNTSLYEKEAANAQVLAETSVQSQAMAQAQSIKQVTDQVRAERMAQLRGGMSESQLADRELQMLMGSVNQLNSQSQMANQEAMAAQLAKGTARETAFNDYITQGTALGQNASADYASMSGNLMDAAIAYQRKMLAEGKVVNITDALTMVKQETPA